MRIVATGLAVAAAGLSWTTGVASARFATPPAGDRPNVWAGPANAGAPATLDAVAQAGFGSAQLAVDTSDPAAARANLDAALQRAASDGLRVDPNVTGAQAFASPALTERTSMQQLVPANAEVVGPRAYDAKPPFPANLVGDPALVAVTAARVVGASGATVLLDPSSAVDLTSRVDAGGVLRWSVPEGTWRLFGFWERATGQVAGPVPFEAPSVWSARVPTASPGRSFLADIFASTGVTDAVRYAADQLFGPDNVARLAAERATLPHDSLEVQAEMFWTGDLPTQFRARRGYALIRYLPALHNVAESSFNPLDPSQAGPLPAPEFDFTGDVGERVRYDYHRTLSDLYVERYLSSLTAAAHALGLRSRVQVAYNYVPLDVTRAAEAVDIPETESFDHGWPFPFDSSLPTYGTPRWRYMVDAYRSTAAGAHIGGHRRVTIEFGDDFAIYRKQPVDYADQMNQAIAGGVTQGVLASFVGVSGQSWPLPSGLSFIGLGENWSTNWPQWRDWSALTTYLARSTQVVERGRPQIDVAVFHDRGLSSVHDSAPLFGSDRLARAGYTYEYVDPVSLTSRGATVRDGRLFADGPAYEALVIDAQRAMPADAARSVLRAARAGVAVVVVGDPPAASTGLRDASEQDAAVRRAMSTLLREPTVVSVATEDAVPAALRRLGAAPAADLGDPSDLVSVHRRTPTGDMWWIYNPTETSAATTGTFATRGRPFRLGLWDGTVEPVARYARVAGGVRLPLTVPAHGTVAFAFRRAARQPTHVIATSAQDVSFDRHRLVVTDTQGGRRSVTLSDGRRASVDLGTVPAPLDLAAWHLSVEEISPSGPTTHELDLQGLRDWRTIPGLESAVGTGTYRTTVDVPAGWLRPTRDVRLSIGVVAGAMRVEVNGRLATAQTTPHVDVSVARLLHAGSNEVTIRVDTTLLNRMVALRDSGDPLYQTGPTPLVSAPSGLLGPVRLVPAGRAILRRRP